MNAPVRSLIPEKPYGLSEIAPGGQTWSEALAHCPRLMKLELTRAIQPRRHFGH